MLGGSGTVTAAAGTLTGTTLASNVTLSSLTSVGTLSAGAVPASLVTAGTFGAGAYTFPGALTATTSFTLTGAASANALAVINAPTAGWSAGLELQAAGAAKWRVGANSNPSGGSGVNAYDLYSYGTSSTVLSIAYATGAATFSSTLRAGGTTTGASLNYGTCSPALNASATILTSVSYGLITVYETYNTGSGALFFVAAGVITKISDPDNVYSTTSGTASKINVTVSSGTITVQNKHLASDIYQANVLFNG